MTHRDCQEIKKFDRILLMKWWKIKTFLYIIGKSKKNSRCGEKLINLINLFLCVWGRVLLCIPAWPCALYSESPPYKNSTGELSQVYCIRLTLSAYDSQTNLLEQNSFVGQGLTVCISCWPQTQSDPGNVKVHFPFGSRIPFLKISLLDKSAYIYTYAYIR